MASGSSTIGLAGTVTVGFGTEDAAYDPVDGYIYAPTSSSGPSQVAVLSGTTLLKTLDTVPITVNHLEGPWFDTSTGYAYVAAPSNIGSESVLSVINGTSVLGNITAGAGPNNDGVFDDGDGDLYVSNSGSGNVTVVNGTAVIASIPVGPLPYEEVYDPSNQDVYVADNTTVTVLHGTTVVATVPVGAQPGPLVWDSRNGFVYVANWDSGNVSVINGTTVIASLNVGAYPNAIIFDAASGFVYVTNQHGQVIAIQGRSVLASLQAASFGYLFGLDYDRANGYLYVPDAEDSSLVVINGSQIVARIYSPGLFGEYSDAAYDSSNGYVYVATGFPAETKTSTVSVVNGTTLLASVTLNGSEPGSPVCSNASGLVYVSNTLSGSVSVVNDTTLPTYSIDFTASGLADGTSWWVSLKGTTEFSTGSGMVVWEPNGTYNYTVESGGGYTPSPSGGVVTVAGGAPTQALTFKAPLTILGLTPLAFGFVLSVLAVGAAAILALLRRRGLGPPPKPSRPSEESRSSVPREAIAPPSQNQGPPAMGPGHS